MVFFTIGIQTLCSNSKFCEVYIFFVKYIHSSLSIPNFLNTMNPFSKMLDSKQNTFKNLWFFAKHSLYTLVIILSHLSISKDYLDQTKFGVFWQKILIKFDYNFYKQTTNLLMMCRTTNIFIYPKGIFTVFCKSLVFMLWIIL